MRIFVYVDVVANCQGACYSVPNTEECFIDITFHRFQEWDHSYEVLATVSYQQHVLIYYSILNQLLQ